MLPTLFIRFSLMFFFLFNGVRILSRTVSAQTTPQDGLREAAGISGEHTLPTGLPTGSIESTAANLIIVVLGIVGILFMLLILYGGYTWMMGSRSGKEKEINNAKTILTNATIGLIIVVAAYAITYFIAQQIEFATTGSLPPDLNNGDQGTPIINDELPHT